MTTWSWLGPTLGQVQDTLNPHTRWSAVRDQVSEMMSGVRCHLFTSLMAQVRGSHQESCHRSSTPSPSPSSSTSACSTPTLAEKEVEEVFEEEEEKGGGEQVEEAPLRG